MGEHNPEEIWQRTREVIAEAMSNGKLQPKDLPLSASPTSARPPLCGTANRQAARKRPRMARHAVADYVSELAKTGGRIVSGKTGLPLTTYFSGLKIRWILENVKGVRELAQSAMPYSVTLTPFWSGT